MEIKSLKLVSFSPTGTTKSVLQGIANGISINNRESIDITSPAARTLKLVTRKDELLIVGVPVYMGRVPDLVNEYLTSVEANDTPTVCVVVYGNRAYENALLELKDILSACGCHVMAGAAFIGEHSFSTAAMPVAKNRPDGKDLNIARKFGRMISGKLNKGATDVASFPGNHPYGGITKLWSVDFIDISQACDGQGICADVCPTGAIDIENTRLIDLEKCISCCACIKKCPNAARSKKPGKVMDASIRLYTLYQARKEPEIFVD